MNELYNLKESRHQVPPFFAECNTFASYPIHKHESYEIECVSGEKCHNVIDGMDYTVSGVMCFLYLPSTHHYYYSENRIPITVYKVGFYDTFLPDEFIKLVYACDKSVAVSFDEHDRFPLVQEFRELLGIYFGEEPYKELLLKSCLEKLLVRIYTRYLREGGQKGLPKETGMNAVYAYINKNYNKDLSLQILADVAGMSPTYFSRYFRKHTGKTYMSYVIDLRMSCAMHLLKITSYSLTKISSEVGYYSKAGFIKTFTHYFGSHPETFRTGNFRDTPRAPKEPDGDKTVMHCRSPVPLPKSFQSGDTLFRMEPVLYAEYAPFACAAEVFGGYLRRLFRVKSSAACDSDHAALIFKRDGDLPAETYRVAAENGVVTITGASLAAVSHGAAAVLQIIEEKDGSLYIPDMTIEDYPDAGWRGVMLDIARNAYPLPHILAYADLCYLYRLDRLHLHFCDGPGKNMYRLPSEHFPKLSADGYSLAEIETLKKYCRNRGITLVPEIEMPAHAEPLVAHYPEVFGGIHHNMVCPGHAYALDGLDTLIGEVCELFPDSPYIHIGCDEAPYINWETCPDCSRFMKENGIVSPKVLYCRTVDITTRMVLRRGRIPVVWEGFPAEGSECISRDVVVMVFQSTFQSADKLTEAGFRVINASWQPLYVVPSRPKYWPPEDIYRWNTCRWLYEDAVDETGAIDVVPSEQTLGAEMCVWEGVNLFSDKNIIRVNLPAAAERIWNREHSVPYSSFEVHMHRAASLADRLLDFPESSPLSEKK